MKKIIITILLLTLNLLASNVATITAIRGDANIKRDGAIIVASLGAKLEQKDRILTKGNSKLQVIFKDETVISIGKNSEFSIQEYLFEDKQEPIARFSMLRGAMRTITGQIGNIAPQRFTVATKTATIGIRGTNFSVFVEDDGSSSAFCTFGAISVAVAGTTHIVQQGFYIALSAGGDVEIKEFTPEVLKEKKEKHFDKKKEEEKEVLVDATDTTGTTEESDETTETSSDNTAQLDVTTDDNSGLVVTELSDVTGDAVQNDNLQTALELTANATIDAFTHNARYEGTFSGTNSGSFDTSGNAILDVYFGTDTATLNLTGNNGAEATYSSFDPASLNTNTFTGGSQLNSTGTADGQFFETTGNTAKGRYSYGESGVITGNGTYEVTYTGTEAPAI